MTTPLPTPSSSRFTPEQREILGQVFSLILRRRWERLEREKNQSTSIVPPSIQTGGSHD